MAEKWKIQDSARTMTKKYNDAIDELNQSLKWVEEQKSTLNTEKLSLEIDVGLSNDALDELLEMPHTGGEN